MKETKEMASELKKDVFGGKSMKQIFVSVWFVLSFMMMIFAGESLLAAIVCLANFACAAYFETKYNPSKGI